MKPYQHIKNLKNIIENEKFNLQYSKNKDRDVKKINTLIDCMESFENMLTEKYYTNVIETLLYSLIYEWMLQFKVASGSEIPLHTIIYNIDKDIENGNLQKKAEIVSILETHEMTNKLKNGTVFEEGADFNGMLTNLVNQFKMNIKWTNSNY